MYMEAANHNILNYRAITTSYRTSFYYLKIIIAIIITIKVSSTTYLVRRFGKSRVNGRRGHPCDG